MRIYGQRADGSVLIALGGGVGVIMRGAYSSKPYDLAVLLKMGPWTYADNSLAARRQAQKQLQQCRTVTLEHFDLGLPSLSYDQRRQLVEEALQRRVGTCYVAPNGIGANWVVYVTEGGQHWGIGYAMNEMTGEVMVEGEPVRVMPSWERLGELDEELVPAELSVFARRLRLNPRC